MEDLKLRYYLRLPHHLIKENARKRMETRMNKNKDKAEKVELVLFLWKKGEILKFALLQTIVICCPLKICLLSIVLFGMQFFFF